MTTSPWRKRISRQARRARGRAGRDARSASRRRVAGGKASARATASRAFSLTGGLMRGGMPGPRAGFGSGSSGRASIMARAARGSKAAAAWRIAPASSIEVGIGRRSGPSVLGDRGEDRSRRPRGRSGRPAPRVPGQDQVCCRISSVADPRSRARGAGRPRRDRPPEILRRPIRVDPDGQRQQPRHRHRAARPSVAVSGSSRSYASARSSFAPAGSADALLLAAAATVRAATPGAPAHGQGERPRQVALGHPGANIGQHVEPGGPLGHRAKIRSAPAGSFAAALRARPARCASLLPGSCRIPARQYVHRQAPRAAPDSSPAPAGPGPPAGRPRERVAGRRGRRARRPRPGP